MVSVWFKLDGFLETNLTDNLIFSLDVLKFQWTDIYLLRSSMVDPSYGGEVEVLTDKQKKAAKAKGKKNKLGTG